MLSLRAGGVLKGESARLTHNVHGPHDEKFHRFLKELEDEYTAVRIAGYSGEGFYSNGTRLGVGRSHNPSMTDARRQALAAAEKRRALSTGSGQKLGGGTKNNVTTPNYQELRERAAAAALRRARISKTCGAESGVRDRGRMEADAERAIMNGFRTQTEEDNANEQAILQAAIDLIAEGEREEEMQRKAWEERGGYVWIEDDDEPIPVPVLVAASTAQSAGSKHSRSASSEHSPAPESKRSVPSNPPFLDTPPTYEEALGISPITWACDLCTLINPASNANCDACGVRRPEEDLEIVEVPRRQSRTSQPIRPGGLKRSTSVGTKRRVRFGPDPVTSTKRMWDCHNCTTANDPGWWTCTACGIMKLSS